MPRKAIEEHSEGKRTHTLPASSTFRNLDHFYRCRTCRRKSFPSFSYLQEDRFDKKSPQSKKSKYYRALGLVFIGN